VFGGLHNYIQSLNNSKLFAGLMIIILNIASKFVTVKLSKTMEAYLKFTFSRQILIFTIAWMGTRDIYIALVITIVFILFMDFLFNEESRFCCLPEAFTDYHVNLLENMSVDALGNSMSSPHSVSGQMPSLGKYDVTTASKEDILNAIKILQQADLDNIKIE